MYEAELLATLDYVEAVIETVTNYTSHHYA